MVKEADDSADGKEPIEVWLTKRNIGITCRVVKQDQSATELDAGLLSMRGARREITTWLKSQGYEPAGRW
jgi:hypothetical protein